MMKKLVILACMATMLAGCGNRQVIDTTWHYNYAYIKLPTGEVVEGDVKAWTGYRGDAVRVVFTDDTVYLTQLSNVVLIERE